MYDAYGMYGIKRKRYGGFIMACFVVPATEAVITTVVNAVLKNKESRMVQTKSTEHAVETVEAHKGKTSFTTKLGWLNTMLWGGSALLAFEHAWHGEVVPYFPFFTAVTNGEVSEMLAEMSSVGVTMALLVTAVWGGMVAVTGIMEKRNDKVQDIITEVI